MFWSVFILKSPVTQTIASFLSCIIQTCSIFPTLIVVLKGSFSQYCKFSLNLYELVVFFFGLITEMLTSQCESHVLNPASTAAVENLYWVLSPCQRLPYWRIHTVINYLASVSDIFLFFLCCRCSIRWPTQQMQVRNNESFWYITLELRDVMPVLLSKTLTLPVFISNP